MDRRRGVSYLCGVTSESNHLSYPVGSTLHACGPEGASELAKHWRESRIPAHTVLVAEEEVDNDVFFILDGHARAATYTNWGREVLLSDIHTGEAFGIFAAIDGRPRSTSVVTVEDSRVGRMTGFDFRRILFGNRHVNRAFIYYMVDRIRATSTRFASAAILSAEQRLISELLRLAERRAIVGDTAVIDPMPTQQELALLTFAAHREAIGRDMSKLRKAGLIRRQGRTLIITSMNGLRARLSLDRSRKAR